jgi:hypothetical protein
MIIIKSTARSHVRERRGRALETADKGTRWSWLALTFGLSTLGAAREVIEPEPCRLRSDGLAPSDDYLEE